MAEKVCPVVAAIREISGAGMSNLEQIGRIGGAEYSFDEITFHFAVRKMELARLELSKPDLIQLRRQLPRYPARTRQEVYDDLVHLTPIGPVNNAIHHIYQCMEALFTGVSNKIRRNSAGKINITLPPPPQIPPVTSPETAQNAVNFVVKFLRALNINVLLREPIRCQIGHFPPFSAPDPQFSAKIPPPTGTSPDELLAGFRAVVAAEEPVYKYLAAVEKYYCDVINILHESAEMFIKMADLL